MITGAQEIMSNPPGAAHATTLAAYDEDGQLWATTTSRQPERRKVSSLLSYERRTDQWLPVSSPYSASEGIWANLHAPMSELSGVTLLHPGLRNLDEPWLPSLGAGPPLSWQTVVAREPHSEARPVPPGSGSLGLLTTPGRLAEEVLAHGSEVPFLLVWVGEREADLDVVSAPIVWGRGTRRKVIKKRVDPRNGPPLRVSLRGGQALVGGRADNLSQQPMVAGEPFVRLDMNTGDILDAFEPNVIDVQFWPTQRKFSSTQSIGP